MLLYFIATGRISGSNNSGDYVRSSEASYFWENHGQAQHPTALTEVCSIAEMISVRACTCSTMFLVTYSDQTDPFNRAPLTPDMLISDLKLKATIQQWKQEQTERRLV